MYQNSIRIEHVIHLEHQMTWMYLKKLCIKIKKEMPVMTHEQSIGCASIWMDHYIGWNDVRLFKFCTLQ